MDCFVASLLAMTVLMSAPTNPDFFDRWRRLIAWVGDHSIEIVSAIGIGLLIVAALIGLRGVARRMLGGPNATGWAKVAEGVLARTYLFFILAAAAKLVALQLELPPPEEDGVNILFVAAAGAAGGDLDPRADHRLDRAAGRRGEEHIARSAPPWG
jgi:hypothetical protein